MRRIQHHKLPCLDCQPRDFIRMARAKIVFLTNVLCFALQVHHLIERCMLFRMSRDDCVRTLAKHVDINPVVTITVWEELLKENKMFFQAYSHSISPSNGRPQEITNVNHYGRAWTSHKR
ncbi:hypothetical protein OSB04_007656 [Centaurea solstitialis]|uniref:Uncharacterized protein n=1 Tax=Centaurea solstitialis TaxID=347529 RepID=A0AA38TVS7_9ASTR|nr:hypothetical protein OSB04_007656 [Centaurea solstitialis]